MSGDLKGSSSHRAPYAAAIVLLFVAAAIALANLSSEPVSADHITGMVNGPQRAHGWPLAWCWVSAKSSPSPTVSRRQVLQWPIARHSASRLSVNLAIWLVALVGTALVSSRLLAKYRLCWRPRWTTLVVLLAGVVLLALANMTFEVSPLPPPYTRGSTTKALFGWPLIWNWYFLAPSDNIYGWDFSAGRLVGNIAIWLGALALAASAWEWLLRRYRPRWRFSLRTMMVAVALVSVLCAWSVAVWKRANEQDALAVSLRSRLSVGSVRAERWGPTWLGLVVPDRFRRRIASATVHLGRPLLEEDKEESARDDNEVRRESEEASGERNEEESDADEEDTPDDGDRRDEEFSARLGRLSTLRSLHIECGRLTPATADVLSNLRQLRALGLRMDRGDGRSEWENQRIKVHPRGGSVDIAWLGKLRQLEHLSLAGVRGDEMACLTNLTCLKSLALDLRDCGGDEPEMDRRLAVVGKLTWLRRVSLEGCPGVQMAHLANLIRLKSLSLAFARFPGDHDRLRQCFAAIGKMTQLERFDLTGSRDRAGTRRPLPIHADDLAFLHGLTNLKSLRLDISCDDAESHVCLAALSHLTQLRRLCLTGDLVDGGTSGLAPLTSLEELTSDSRMATPAAIDSLSMLKRLRAVHIAGLDMSLARIIHGCGNKDASGRL